MSITREPIDKYHQLPICHCHLAPVQQPHQPGAIILGATGPRLKTATLSADSNDRYCHQLSRLTPSTATTIGQCRWWRPAMTSPKDLLLDCCIYQPCLIAAVLGHINDIPAQAVPARLGPIVEHPDLPVQQDTYIEMHWVVTRPLWWTPTPSCQNTSHCSGTSSWS